MLEPADLLNRNILVSYLSSLIALSILITSIRLIKGLLQSSRHCTPAYTRNFHNTKFTAFEAVLKAFIIYGPLWRFRRAREATFFNGRVNFGQLPSRSYALCIVLFLGLNIFLFTWNLPWSAQATDFVPLIRNRLGTVAVSNLIPIVLTSAVYNPLIPLLGISYDGFNSLHRWFSRITVLELIAHGLCNVLGVGIHQGWANLRARLETPYVYYGLTAAISLVLIFVLSPKPIRSFAYEIFHWIHICLVVTAFTFIWLHLAGHFQRYCLLTAVLLWATARLLRFINIIYRSFSFKKESCTAHVEQLPEGAVKVSLHVARPWTFQPGQYLYLSIPQISLGSFHPFSIAWTDQEPLQRLDYNNSQSQKDVEQGEATDRSKILPYRQSSNKQNFYLIIRKRSGMTNSLFERLEANDKSQTFTALIQGPHGNVMKLEKYGTVLFLAAGVGITHPISFLKDFLDKSVAGAKEPRKVRLVWAVPTTAAIEWIKPWLQYILHVQGQTDKEVDLKISLFITRQHAHERNLEAFQQHVDIKYARPDIASIVEEEMNQHIGKALVSVCAGGGFADEVRASSRRLLREGVDLDFHEEGFGW